MSEGKAIDLTRFNGEAFKAWLDSFDTVLFDCDGKKKQPKQLCLNRKKSY